MVSRDAVEADVQRVGADADGAIRRLLTRFGLDLELVVTDEDIPASFWGPPEAGIAGTCVYARSDTPVHSVLHEAAHVICMTAERRAVLERDAGGDDLEEAAVCYLQIVLARYLPAVGENRLMRDMDAWGYSFRLGAAARWFANDAADARAWLEAAGIVGAGGEPLWVLRR